MRNPTIGEIPEHWVLTTLGDVCNEGNGSIQTGPFGSQLHAADYVDVGIPSIMPVNIGDNRVVETDIKRVTEEDAERLSKHRVKAGDIVYSRRGDVERRALIREPEVGWLCGTGCLKVSLGAGITDPLYASFYLDHPMVREWIVRHAHGATMPNLNTSIMKEVPFVLPPIHEQKAIAHILGTLDDKIELNRETNKTLEAIAKAIFKSWFVDFDPVHYKQGSTQQNRKSLNAAADEKGASTPNDDPTDAARYSLSPEILDLFPDSFQDSELGEIPAGWEISSLDQKTAFVLGGDWGKSEFSDDFPNSVLCIRGADIPSLQQGEAGSMPERYIKDGSITKRQLTDGDLVFEISGGSPTQSTGRPVQVTNELINRFESPLVC